MTTYTPADEETHERLRELQLRSAAGLAGAVSAR
jgi:hypothetical protein